MYRNMISILNANSISNELIEIDSFLETTILSVKPRFIFCIAFCTKASNSFFWVLSSTKVLLKDAESKSSKV